MNLGYTYKYSNFQHNVKKQQNVLNIEKNTD